MNKERKIIEKAHKANVRKMLNLFADFRRLYQHEKFLFAMGGSLALEWMNLLNRNIGDLDIMVSADAKDFISFIKNYITITGQNTLYGSGSGSPDANDALDVKEHLKLQVQGKNVCIFIMEHKHFLGYTATFKNMRVALPDYILNAKIEYLKRLKNVETRTKHTKDIEFIKKGIKEACKHLY